MCDDFGQVVSDSVYELKVLREKAVSKEVICAGLLCGCKQKLLSNYLAISSNLMNLMGGMCQALSVIKDIDTLNDRMAVVKGIFRENALHGLVTYEGVTSVACPKMIVLFYIIQKQMEDMLFQGITEKMVPFLGSLNGEKIKVCQEILDDIYDFAEAAVFTLSGLRINCNNIDDSLYTHPNSMIQDVKSCEIHDSKRCIFLSGRQKVECLHLFMTPGFVKVRKWIDNYFDIFKGYHIKPTNLHLMIDFKLMDKYSWTKEDNDRLQNIKKDFGKVFIVNAEHIDFSDFGVEITDILEIKECVLECDLNNS